MVRTLSSLASPAQGCSEHPPRGNARPTGREGNRRYKLCRADGPAARGGGWHPGRGRPLALAARPPPPFLPALARHRLGPSPLPPPARASLVRSLAGSSSLARPRPAQLGQSVRGAERASARGAPAADPGPRPPPRLPPSLPRSLPLFFPGSRAVRPPRSPRLRAPRSQDARGPAARRGTRPDHAAPRSAPGKPRGRPGRR